MVKRKRGRSLLLILDDNDAGRELVDALLRSTGQNAGSSSSGAGGPNGNVKGGDGVRDSKRRRRQL
jgi:hypothetical protein